MKIEDDGYAGMEVERLCKQFGVELIIETGTYYGTTAKQFAEIAPVWTIEINEENHKIAKENLKECNNATLFLGNSVDVLRETLKTVSDKTLLFFLDAHWYDYCPLVDELMTIAAYRIVPVIVIHDIMVPGKDFGYDNYNGKPLCFDLIKDSIELIYGKEGYSYHYNEDAEGAKRGLIYLYSSIQ